MFFQVGPDRQSPLTLWIRACILTFQEGLEVLVFARVFIYIRNLCMLAVKDLTSLRLCAADSPEPSLLDNVKCIKISRAGSYHVQMLLIIIRGCLCSFLTSFDY